MAFFIKNNHDLHKHNLYKKWGEAQVEHTVGPSLLLLMITIAIVTIDYNRIPSDLNKINSLKGEVIYI